ncbi:hypothetical protein CSUB01_07718 [Colletotrichum sublineola]|uniref:Uncharacterized protein n=1 Tax=Colletotrichum sublineola TaxID=1173701 RepID=A0A066WTQ6_COLSU|nr:hypothetical protein CSUB01_07718 [Colletotrichum sublineola]
MDTSRRQLRARMMSASLSRIRRQESQLQNYANATSIPKSPRRHSTGPFAPSGETYEVDFPPCRPKVWRRGMKIPQDSVKSWDLDPWGRPFKAPTATSTRDGGPADLSAGKGQSEPSKLPETGDGYPITSAPRAGPRHPKLPSRMSRPLWKPDERLRRRVWEEAKLQHGLIQELEKKHNNEKTQDFLTPTSEKHASAVQGGQSAPTKAKTLLEIYHQAKAETSATEE